MYRMRRFASVTSKGRDDGVVGEILFAGRGASRRIQCPLRPRHRREKEWFCLEASVGAQRDLVFFQDFVAVADHEGGLFAGVAVLREGHGGGYTGVNESLFPDTYILDLDIVLELFATESDGVHGKTAIAQGLESVGTDSGTAEAGRVLSAIAKKDDCTDRKIRGVRDEFSEPIIDAGGGSRGRDALGAVDALDVAVEAIKARLKTILETGRTPSLRAASAASSRARPFTSVEAILRESSMTTAMMFCCELSSPTVIAGCHRRSNRSANVDDCMSQMIQARQFRRFGAALRRRQRMRSAKAPTAVTIKIGSSQAGHVLSSTKRPFVNTGIGYLKRN